MSIRRARAAACGLAMLRLLLGTPADAVAQPMTPPPAAPAIYSPLPMMRNADLLLSGAVLAGSGTDALLDKSWAGARRHPGLKGRLVRATKLLAFDVPVVAYFVGLNHELGHTTRATEQGFRSRLDFVGTPWSARAFELWALDSGIFTDLGSQAGGLEASRRLKDLGEAWMRRADRVSAGHAVATIAASVDLPLYAFWNLAPDKFDRSPGTRFPDGDVGRFVRVLAARGGLDAHEEFDRLRREVRARSRLNLLDAGLWTLAAGLVRDYVWNGEDGVRVRWIDLGPIGIIPSVRYELSPIGPEYYVRSHFKLPERTGMAYVRWSDHLAASRQVGFGFSTTLSPIGVVQPRMDFDVWSHTTEGRGVHAAVSAELLDWPSRRAALSTTVGAKSSGYLLAHPLESGAYVNAGLVLRFW